ncbi:hypothetical protein ABIB25_004760 [Nakamurella sp. UYEF19]|uniref:VOC family protein n=1 Tax=Nakamurella sp. UYEF19 TaxID=1756392 RepID=UPI003393422D
MTTLPMLRQVVLMTGQLDDALERTRSWLGLHAGIREVQAMAQWGFEHEVLAIDETFVEIVSPLAADSGPGRLLAARGDSGYMVVLQVPNLQLVVDRAAAAGITPVVRDVLDGNPISQWHPRDLGTLAEIDEIEPGGSWHFCPALSDTGSSEVVSDLASVEIAVTDPAGYAARWATLLDLPLDDGATDLVLAQGRLCFVRIQEAGRGLTSATFTAAPGTPAGERTVCGVRLIVSERQEDRT